MVRKLLILFIFCAFSLEAALGSGPFIRAAFGFTGLFGDELYMIPSEAHYRHIPSDSLFEHYRPFDKSGIVLRPLVVVGWEQSFNRVLSVNSGVGLSFSGASWKSTPVYEVNNQYQHQIAQSKTDASLNLVYITIPVDAKLMFPLNSGGFTISGGPRFSFLSSAKFKNEILSEESDDRSLYQPFSLGVGGAFGGEIQLRKLDLLLALRIDAGLTNESKDKSIMIRNYMLGLETGLRWTTNRHKKSPKWPL